MLQRNKETEAKVQQALATFFTMAQMFGGKSQLVKDLSAFGLKKVTGEWAEIEWCIQTVYDAINAIKGEANVVPHAITIQ